MKIDNELTKRIIDNESIVKELEMLHAAFNKELGDCKSHIVTKEDCRNYGINPSSLISSVLATYLELKLSEFV